EKREREEKEQEEGEKREQGERENSIQKVVEKIEDDSSVYITPPSYEKVGRGLVYNCKGKHWACVDRPSYFRCKKNHAWIKKHNRPIECVTVNAYANIKDCQTIQKYNINMVVPVNFCED
ncbi:MAG: hypothetical protein OXB84_09135, partial [Halobacteriovoraceae bacterium]|nr:hypothetical protein [Halobacteriovoraceae bacterium]